MSERNLDGCNEVLDDNPERWLITFSLVPNDGVSGCLTETRIIETEPSLWWRSEKWQETEQTYEDVHSIDEVGKVGEVKEVPLYKMCLILMVHYIGK
jgi:hypothetical protein